jgi:hypothetical protein
MPEEERAIPVVDPNVQTTPGNVTKVHFRNVCPGNGKFLKHVQQIHCVMPEEERAIPVEASNVQTIHGNVTEVHFRNVCPGNGKSLKHVQRILCAMPEQERAIPTKSNAATQNISLQTNAKPMM